MAKTTTTKKKTSASAKKKTSRSAKGKGDGSASVLNDAKNAGSRDWRTEILARARAVIMQADPGIVEEVKWRKPSNAMQGVPVWSHPACGMICTGETYKSAVKLTFAKGASLDDPSGLFNASLEGGTRRAIDFHEGDKINEKALKSLIRAAINADSTKSATTRSRKK